MNYQLQEVRTPVKEFFPPEENNLNAADFSIRHTLDHRYIDGTTVEVVQLEHSVTIFRKSDNATIMRLIVECDYGISGTLSIDDEAIMDMIENSFTYLNKEYFLLLNGHPLGAYNIEVDVDFGALVEKIKRYKRSGLNW